MNLRMRRHWLLGPPGDVAEDVRAVLAANAEIDRRSTHPAALQLDQAAVDDDSLIER
jgi:hypothetical protein